MRCASSAAAGRIEEVHPQQALPVRRRHVGPVDDLEELDPVPDAGRAHGLPAALVAAEVGAVMAHPRLESAPPDAPASPGRRRTPSLPGSESSARTCTPSTWTTSASHCCSAPSTRARVAAASAPPFGSNTRPQQPAAELRPVHPLPGCREQHLLDEVADVVLAAGRTGSGRSRRSRTGSRRSATSDRLDPDLGDRRWSPACRWVRRPPGCRPGAAARRPQRTRVAPTVHCAVTQGTGPPGVVKGQPATAYGPDSVVAG